MSLPEPASRRGLAHASRCLGQWLAAYRASGRLALLLDFDGTLAPIAARPDLARMPEAAGAALARLHGLPGVDVAVVSGRGLADVRERVGIAGLWYAGNHGMEIAGPGFGRVEPAAVAARPLLLEVAERLTSALRSIPGAIVEDKELSLSVHYRLAAPAGVMRIRAAVREAARACPGLRTTQGKRVLEVRPAVDWDKGRAVDLLLAELNVPRGAPAVFLGDDRTDEDAFAALRRRGGGAAGVLVADSPAGRTSAVAWVRDSDEVADLLGAMASALGA